MDDDLKPLFNKLTRLQKGVCLGVLEGMTHRQAYYAAGGIAKTEDYADQIVSRMLSSDIKVKAFMEAAEGKAVTSAIMTKQEALQRLSNIARTNVAELVEFGTATIEGPDGPVRQTYWHLKDGVELNPDQMALISELSAGKDGFKFKTHSPLQAKKQLGEMLGWNAPQKTALTDSEGNDLSDLEKGRAILYAIQSALGSKDSPQGTSNSNKQGEDNE